MKTLPCLLGSVLLALFISCFTHASTQVDPVSAVLDPTFTPGAGPNDTVYTAVIGPDDKVWIGGRFTEVDGHMRHGIARLAPNGALDPGFVSPLGPSNEVHAIALLPGSRGIIVALRTTGERPAIALISPDGTTMTRLPFEESISITGWGTASSIVVLGDGETIVTADDNGLVFFLPNGLGGYAQKRVTASVMFPSYDRSIGALTVDGSGRPVAAGGFNIIGGVEQAYFARFLPNGHLDPEFKPQIPLKKPPGPFAFRDFWAAAALPDGSPVGALTETFRLNSKGDIDPNFQRLAYFPSIDLGPPTDGTSIRNPQVIPLHNDYFLLHSIRLPPLSLDGTSRGLICIVRPDGGIASVWNLSYSPQSAIQDVAVDHLGNVSWSEASPMCSVNPCAVSRVSMGGAPTPRPWSHRFQRGSRLAKARI